MRSTNSFRIFLSLVVMLSTLLFLSTGMAQAKDWKFGDHGDCPGTLDSKLGCHRPYLCEPTPCYGCTDVYSAESRCVHCGALAYPGCRTAQRKDPDAPATTTTGTLQGAPPPLPYHPIHKLKITPTSP